MKNKLLSLASLLAVFNANARRLSTGSGVAVLLTLLSGKDVAGSDTAGVGQVETT